MRKIKKALKWAVVVLCLMQNVTPLLAQSEDENLRKYWNYRDRFRKYLIPPDRLLAKAHGR